MTDLSSVKPGDKLLIDNRYNQRISVVARITPGGRVVTEGGDKFNPNGRRIGEADRWNITRAWLATPEDFERIRRGNAIYRLYHTQWAKLSTETIDAVRAVLDCAQGTEARRAETSAAQAPSQRDDGSVAVGDAPQ